MSERPPEAALWDALRGGLVARALGLVAELDIARLLDEEARPVAELAAAVPAGDAHVLSTILHDWDDESALRILRTVRASAGERLVLLESVIQPGNEPSGAKWLDLLMLVIAAGRERREAEWRALLTESGWEPVRLESGVIEARPR